MYHVDFLTPIHVHFIGIGGISMSGLARILLQRNFKVSGSDSQNTKFTRALESEGAIIYIGQSYDNIKEGTDLVVYSAAIHDNNPEYKSAVDKGIPMLSRAQFLGQLMTNYKDAIAISGTHGKTTTTSMVSSILLEAKKDPTITVGGVLPMINSNVRVGKSDLFVAEACEYQNSFLSFKPTTGVILNVELDHIDFFKDLDAVYSSFHSFAKLLPADGLLVLNGEIEKKDVITEDIEARVVYYGLESKDEYTAINITYDKKSCPRFTLVRHGEELGEIDLCVPGAHNVSNALAAIATCMEMGVDFKTVANGLYAYKGTDRRFEYKGEINGFKVYDDFAHHPTEMMAACDVFKKYECNKMWLIFQPHTFTRTKAFLDDFAEVLTHFENVIITEIYPAREEDIYNIHSIDLVKAVEAKGKKVFFEPTFADVKKFVMENCKAGDLVVTMGCGNIYIVADELVEEFGTK